MSTSGPLPLLLVLAASLQARVIRWFLIAAVAVACAWAGWIALYPEPPDVLVHVMQTGPMEVRVEADGVTRIRERVVVSAPAAGQTSRLALRPGDTLRAGDVITQLSAPPAALLDARTRAETEARGAGARDMQRQAQRMETLAQQALDFAQTEESRLAHLQERGTVTMAALESAQFAVRSREADLASARLQSRVARHNVDQVQAVLQGGDATEGSAMAITAPIDGVVLRGLQEEASVVAPGTPILEMGDPAAIEVVADVLTANAVRIDVGAHVTLGRWGGQADLRGHVARIEPQAFTRISALGVEEQRVNVRIDLDGDPSLWQRVGDGWRIEAGIRTWMAPSVLQVPQNALFRYGEQWAVYTVDNDVVRLTPVQPGQRDDRTAQVLSGLEQGDRVILHPTDAIHDGLRVIAVVDTSLSPGTALFDETGSLDAGSDLADNGVLPETVNEGSAE